MPRGCFSFLNKRDGGAPAADGAAGPAPPSTFPPKHAHKVPLGPPSPPVPASPPTVAQAHAADQLLACPDTRPARVCAALLANAAAHPGEARFRRIRLANPRVHANVTCVPGALELLEASGFRVVFESASKRDPEARAEGFAVLRPEVAILPDPARAALVAGVKLLRPALPPSLAATSTFTSLISQPAEGGEGEGGEGGGEEASSPPPPAPPVARALSRLRFLSTSGAGGCPATPRVPACGADAAADAACVGHGDDDDDDDDDDDEGGGAPPPAATLTHSPSARAAGAAAGGRPTLVLLPSPAAPLASQPPPWVAALLPPATAAAAACAATAAAARARLATPAQRAASLARVASRRASSATAGAGAEAPATTTRLTVRLPEGVSLAADFAPSDWGGSVSAWVAACLAPRTAGGPDPSFDLLLASEGDSVPAPAPTPAPALGKKATLASAGLVPPAASLALVWKGGPPTTALLKEELMGEARVVMG